jgi:hypothetical protein
MEHPRGAFKVNYAQVVRAVKETGQPDHPLLRPQQSERPKFVQEI